MGPSSPQHQVGAAAASRAFTFVLMMGVVNLFADLTYEGASSVNGPFLSSLGATAAAIGVISGIGEFLGYALRFVAGWISDKTGRHWLMTFVGYTINLLAVPALALANDWTLAACLIIAERVGRAIRKPTVESMLSYTTSHLGKGWVYGLNTTLDQTGATIGPLLVALVLLLKGSYQLAYALLLISALLALAALTAARVAFPAPSDLEAGPTARAKGFTLSYWLYMLAGACVAAGLMSFELISYHFSKTESVTEHWIPIFFAVAMGTDAIAGLIFGRLFDRFELPVVIVAFLLSSLLAPLVFWGDFYVALSGIVLWGIGFGAQDTLLKAIIAGLLPEGKRNLAFGLFYTGYGTGWLLGSITSGLLYEHSLGLVVGFSVGMQLIALVIFGIAHKTKR